MQKHEQKQKSPKILNYLNEKHYLKEENRI